MYSGNMLFLNENDLSEFTEKRLYRVFEVI